MAGEMRPTVQGHDPGVVHHLVEDGNVARTLKDLEVLVVAARSNGGTRIESEQAPLGESSVLRAIESNTIDTKSNRTGRSRIVGG